MLLYVEQPFPYDLEAHRIDVHSVSARKPLFMDESAHDWRFVRLGRELGWSGVALKTCKTQTGALLSPLLGQGPRHDADGPGPVEPDARADPARPAWRPMPARSWGSNPTACSSIRRPRCPRPPSTPASFAAAMAVSTSPRFTGLASAIASTRSSGACRPPRSRKGDNERGQRSFAGPFSHTLVWRHLNQRRQMRLLLRSARQRCSSDPPRAEIIVHHPSVSTASGGRPKTSRQM